MVSPPFRRARSRVYANSIDPMRGLDVASARVERSGERNFLPRADVYSTGGGLWQPSVTLTTTG